MGMRGRYGAVGTRTALRMSPRVGRLSAVAVVMWLSMPRKATKLASRCFDVTIVARETVYPAKSRCQPAGQGARSLFWLRLAAADGQERHSTFAAVPRCCGACSARKVSYLTLST